MALNELLFVVFSSFNVALTSKIKLKQNRHLLFYFSFVTVLFQHLTLLK